MRILLVDDDPTMRVVCQHVLERGGASVVSAPDAAAGVAALARGRFDVVLCDEHLPDRSGLSVLAAAAARQPEAVRILMSGDLEPRDPDRAAGVMDAFWSKPTIDVADSLRRLLRPFLHPGTPQA